MATRFAPTDWRAAVPAPASATPSEAPRPLAGAAHGAAGALGPPSGVTSGSTLNDNRLGIQSPGAAEGATAIARLEGTR